MTLQERLDAALKRLSAALDQLEAADARRIDQDARRRNPAERLAAFQEDHEACPGDPEKARLQSQSLDSAHAEVLLRLKRAHAAIESILARGQAD